MKYCPGCGREVRAGANFCGRCGHRLSSTGPEGVQSEQTTASAGRVHQDKPALPGKKKKRGKSLATVLLVLIVIIVAMYYSPFEKLKLPFAVNRSTETGFKGSGDNNTANGDYSSIQIDVAHHDGKSPSPGPGSDEIDDEKPSPAMINQATRNIEQALLSGDQALIREVMTDNALANYGNNLSGINRDELVKFGEAFKSRELKTFSPLYSEYTINLDGQEFTVSVARQSDGSWKIMRF